MTLHTLFTKPSAIELREPSAANMEACGRIMYVAFRRINESRGFPPDFPTVEAAIGLAKMLIADPAVYGVVAAQDGHVIGSNFLTEGDPIRGVGPITVDPNFQGAGVGRRLMQAVIDRGRSGEGVRLVQGAFNTVSMSLYASLGFEAREPLVVVAGQTRDAVEPGWGVRLMHVDDIAEANELCRRVTGFARNADVTAAVSAGTAIALERSGRLVGYMTSPEFWIGNHAVAESEADIQRLILGAAGRNRPLSFLLPIRRAELFRWVIAKGFRVVQPMTLMTLGAYSEPQGGYLPSVYY